MIQPLLRSLCIFLLASLPVQGNLNDARDSARADLERALNELSSLRERISEEKIPLAKELRENEGRVAERRREAERLQRQQDSRSVDLDALRREVEQRETELIYLRDLVTDYLRSFESRIHSAEWQTWQPQIRAVIEATSDPSLSDEARWQKRMDALKKTLERTSNLAGPRHFEGKAIDNEGILAPGTFLIVGPYGYFAPLDGTAGITARSRTLEPTVVPIPESEALATTIHSQNGPIWVDPTEGDALLIAATGDSFTERIRKGGLWIWPILSFALVALIVTLLKGLQILRIREPSPRSIHEFAEAIWKKDRLAACRTAATLPQPFREVLEGLGAAADEPHELQEEIAFEKTLAVQTRLERWLPVLALTAATTPLLGLLGTVTGMIKTFNLIQVFGTGDAGRLAGGISEALITTEFGLLVAIPTLIAHAFLSRRAQGVVAQLESITAGALHTVNSNPEEPSSQK